MVFSSRTPTSRKIRIMAVKTEAERRRQLNWARGFIVAGGRHAPHLFRLCPKWLPLNKNLKRSPPALRGSMGFLGPTCSVWRLEELFVRLDLLLRSSEGWESGMKKPFIFREFEPALWNLCVSNVQPLSHPGPLRRSGKEDNTSRNNFLSEFITPIFWTHDCLR